MKSHLYVPQICLLLLVYLTPANCLPGFNGTKALRDKALEMFDHAYSSYMTHAFPADELMPLSCQGRYRGNRPSRGDVDESLGNFTLTLVDTLDTLAILGRLDEFETAIRLVLAQTSFDTDVVVSVFETNIRMLGGLLGGHVAAIDLKSQGKCCQWYTDGLLQKALDIGERLLPAFETSSGLPYPKVNLKTGLKNLKFRDTCTACAGTMVLEFAALSRLTGDKRFEETAHKAMDFLWDQRNVHSNLMGTVLNVHSGDWVRRESGIGAGIDSYYEYLLKAYILLGDDVYLTRFNKHYDAIMTYINQGPIMLSVDMHKPHVGGRNIMDSLLAFWPGLQVLKGDLKSAIEMHEVLYQITQRHNFLPEAVTADFHVHWGQHPLRPEFVESTYFLYKATGDPHYRDVGRTVLENLEKHARVPCGFAAIKDVRGNTHEDQMDSFVLAETFKYLYLLFEDEENLALDVSQYVFTTEAHILPLSLANHSIYSKKEMVPPLSTRRLTGAYHDHSCPNIRELSRMSVVRYAQSLRTPLKNFVELKCPKPKPTRTPRLRAREFTAGDTTHAKILNSMGVQLLQTSDGRLQLTHSPTKADSDVLAEEGLSFMKEMLDLAQNLPEPPAEPRVLQIISRQDDSIPTITVSAGPAQFGWDFKSVSDSPRNDKAYKSGFMAALVTAEPHSACEPLTNADDLAEKMVLVVRGGCTFIEKARQCEAASAVGVVVEDNVEGSSRAQSGFFQMSGDGNNDVSIPVVFLFSAEAKTMKDTLKLYPDMEVYLTRGDLPVTKEREKPAGSYPKNIITYSNTNMNVYVQMKRFAIALTVQNAVSDDRDEVLSDAIEVEMTDGAFTVAITPAKIVTFDAKAHTGPAKGELSEAISDLIVKYLVKCNLKASTDTYISHMASFIDHVYQAYSGGGGENPGVKQEQLTHYLIAVLDHCIKKSRDETGESSTLPEPEMNQPEDGESEQAAPEPDQCEQSKPDETESQEAQQERVSDLDTPHVGDLPEFYTKPAQETVKESSRSQIDETTPDKDTPPVGPPTPRPSPTESATQETPTEESQGAKSLNTEQNDILDSLNESETEKHINTIAPENERAGKYSRTDIPADNNPADSNSDHQNKNHRDELTGKDEL